MKTCFDRSSTHAWRVFFSCCVAALFLAGLAPRADATSVLKLTNEQIVELSTLFVRGKVVNQRAVWAPGKIGIVTLVTLQVEEEVLGRKAPAEVTIRHFGGTIGKVSMTMPGNVSFTNGDEVLVALEASKYLPPNEYLLIGLNQGKWLIQPADPQASTKGYSSSRLISRASMAHINLVQRGPNVAPKNNNAPAKTLSGLVTQLRAHWVKIQQQRKLRTLPIKLKKAAPVQLQLQLKKPIQLEKPLRLAPQKPAQVKNPSSQK